MRDVKIYSRFNIKIQDMYTTWYVQAKNSLVLHSIKFLWASMSNKNQALTLLIGSGLQELNKNVSTHTLNEIYKYINNKKQEVHSSWKKLPKQIELGKKPAGHKSDTNNLWNFTFHPFKLFSKLTDIADIYQSNSRSGTLLKIMFPRKKTLLATMFWTTKPLPTKVLLLTWKAIMENCFFSRTASCDRITRSSFQDAKVFSSTLSKEKLVWEQLDRRAS